MSHELEGNFYHQLEINSQHVNREISLFSQAVFNHPKTKDIVNYLARTRLDLTPLHFSLLFYSSYKYSFFNTKSFATSTGWSEIIDVVNADPPLLIESLLNRSVNITSPYRYSAIKLAISKLSGAKPISVADIGCGFYPFGIGYQKSDCIPQDETGQTPTSLSSVYSRIEAMDLQKPDPVWTAASQWEPIHQMQETVGKYRQLLAKSDQSIHFQIADITRQTPKIEPVDYCFTANILYQIPIHLKEAALRNIFQILKPSGTLFTADFLPNGSRKKPFTYAIQAHHPHNGSISDGKIIFLLENADCKKIRYV